MFEPITLPFGARMLFNAVKLKPGVKFEDVELAVGEIEALAKMCSETKELGYDMLWQGMPEGQG